MSVFNTVSKVTDSLFLSGYRAVTKENVEALGITHIINATYDLPNAPPDVNGIEFVRIRVEDTPDSNLAEYFDQVGDKINQVTRSGGKTLVHCMAGISRSSALVLAYLVKYHKMTLKAAFKHLKAKRPIVHPNSGFFTQLIAYEARIHGVSTVKMVSVTGAGGSLVVPDVYMEECKAMMWLKTARDEIRATAPTTT